MTPENTNQTLNTNQPTPTDSDCCKKTRWWPLWLLGGLILLFLIMIIILRGLCSDVWYINLLKLNDKLCETSGVSSGTSRQFLPGLSLEGNSLTIEGGNTVVLPVKEGPEGKEGPKGSTGSKGSTGAKGENGATGPAGPTDPCVTTGTYFCQGGNSYGAQATLGTNDLQNLEVVTASQSTQRLDVQGNILATRIAELAVLPGVSFDTSYGNSVNEIIFAVPGASSFTNSNGNDLMVEAATIIDSNYNIGWAVGSTLNNTQANLGYFGTGTNIQGGFGLVGQFVGATIDNSNNLMGSFDTSMVSSSNSMLAQLSNATVNSVQNSIVYLTGGSLSASQNSLINVNGGGGALTGIAYSVVIGQSDLTVTNSFESTIFGSDNTITDVYSSAVLGTGNTANNLQRVTVSGVGVNMSNSRNTSLVGFGVVADNADWSNFNSFNSTINDTSWSDLRVNSSQISNVSHFMGNIRRSSVINNVNSGAAEIISSNINDAGGLVGVFSLANIDNTTNLYGSFGGYCETENPDDPPFGCNIGYDIQFDIDNSDQLSGGSRWVDIYNSNRLLIQATSSDPLVFSGTIDDVSNSSVIVRDSDVIDSSYSSVIAANSSVTGLNFGLLIGHNISLDADADPTYDYSFIGSDSAGNINTRINSKGDDSWLNLSGGSVGVGTSTPTGVAANGNLETTGGVRVGTLDAATATNVCIDVDGDLSACSSSERYKDNIQDLGLGLDTIMSLRAVSFDWKGTGENDFGFVAEEVAALNGLLATYNKDGEVQGVKYDQLTAILTNAIQEQQGKLEDINNQLVDQGLRIDNLTEDLKALAARVDQHDTDIKELREEVKELKKLLQTSTTTPQPTSQP